MAIAGAAIGAALQGMRPVAEIMYEDFLTLATEQIVNQAAKHRYMSGGQLSVPVVVRMATGAGRQLAAQHSHSLEGWYTHIPGLRIVAPATLEDARGMLWTALEDPDPVLIFENGALYNMQGEMASDAGTVDIDKAATRRPGTDISLITYGGTLGKTLEAAHELAKAGVNAEVVERRVDREPRRRQAVDVVRRLERGREHPVDGEDHHDEDREREQVPAEAAVPLLLAAARRSRGYDVRHLRFPAFTIWRT